MVGRWIIPGTSRHEEPTGAMMSLQKGAAYSTSKKHKLNTVNSTKAELVSVHDVMPQILWTRYFLEEKGYGIRDNILYQDNQSASGWVGVAKDPK